jgi:hypothetical protein
MPAASGSDYNRQRSTARVKREMGERHASQIHSQIS